MGSIIAVARAAGVAASTVSRVLNGSDEISEPTRKKVLSAAERLGYRVRRRGRPSRLSEGRQVLLTYSRQCVRDGAMTTLCRKWMAGVKEKLTETGYSVVLLASEPSAEHDFLFRQGLDAGEYRGAIMFGQQESDGYLQAILEAGLPAVAMNRPPVHAAWSCVTADYYGGAIQAAEYIAGLGHNRVAVSVGHGWQGTEMRAGFVAALQRRQSEPVLNDIPDEDAADPRYARDLASRIRAAKATAVLVGGDYAAAALIDALAALHVRVPRDISVVGYDDMEVYTGAGQRLTTVGFDKHLMGWQAAAVLQRMMRSDSGIGSMTAIVRATMVTGETCAPPGAEASAHRAEPKPSFGEIAKNTAGAPELAGG